jgi:hypothetical protein
VNHPYVYRPRSVSLYSRKPFEEKAYLFCDVSDGRIIINHHHRFSNEVSFTYPILALVYFGYQDREDYQDAPSSASFLLLPSALLNTFRIFVVVSKPVIKNTTMKFAVASLLVGSAAAWSSLNMKAGKRYLFSKGLFRYEKVPSGNSTEICNGSFRWARIGLCLLVSPRWL